MAMHVQMTRIRNALYSCEVVVDVMTKQEKMISLYYLC